MLPFDLSIRYKTPLWGSLLVIVTALAVSATLMINTYHEMEEDLIVDAQTLAAGLNANIFSALQQDDVWHGYETVSEPLQGTQVAKAENLIVVGNDQRVFVAARPRAARQLTPLATLGEDYAAVAARIRDAAQGEVVHMTTAAHLYVLAPIAREGERLGTLVVVQNKDSFIPRFLRVARYGVIAGLLILCILLPINWYWGWRMALPLVELTRRMEDLGNSLPEALDPALYAHRDELGSLFQTYNKMLAELKDKEALEQQVVQSDRLAALGQLAAGVAHEINNPLGGMLMAIDTLKHHGVTDPRTTKTIALLERGLGQIRETVGALLVEARLKSRKLTPADIDDVLVLIQPQAHKKALHLEWHSGLDTGVETDLPATLVRQVLINLLLNAIQAAETEGHVACAIACNDAADGRAQLRIDITNDGRLLNNEQIGHLFEPFSPLSQDGHGLGLWVSYQIVHQLGGTIAAAREAERMHFTVTLPLGEHPA